MQDNWLMCDFHIHTTISDGKMPLDEVVDLYGENGFDVISITDHILDSQTSDEKAQKNEPLDVMKKEDFPGYLKRLWQESKRAWDKYKMLLIPGVEISNNSGKYHILGIDIKEYINPDLSVGEIVSQIHDQGAIAVACHPHHKSTGGQQEFIHLWENHEQYASLFDAWEVANRDDLFNVIGLKKFNYIANSDFHHPWHFYSWKSLLHCEKNTEAVKATIRENKGVALYLFRKEKPIK
ncbi:MAG: phosphotransferase [Candidatus Latescibacteria bacterium]|nr:phosphotransferase [Candidatus Latescibacterota bacterium]